MEKASLPRATVLHIQLANMAPAPPSSGRIEEAQKLAKFDPSKAQAIYEDILSKGPGSGEAALREYEIALMGLGELYRDKKQSNELAKLVTTSRSTLSSFAKAKTAKLGRLPALLYSLSTKLTVYSPPAPRPIHRDTQHRRHSNLRHQVMYRMGHFGTT